MKRLRVMVMMHVNLVPPESTEGMSIKEIHPFEAELDVLRALEELGHEVVQVPIDEELAPIKRAIEEYKPHIAFNMLTSFLDIGIYDAYVVSHLEMLRTAYTGCNPRGLILASNKPLSKKIMTYHRIPVPGFAVYKLRQSRIVKPKRLNYPLFVKSTVEHSSVGIAQASIVRDDDSLHERVEFIHRHVGTNAIAEEFIEGREFTVSVVGNQRLETFPLWELTFENLPEGSKNIATSKLKWDVAYQEKVGLDTGPAKNMEPDKAAAIAKLAKRVYRALDLSGYARLDLRMTEAGDVFVIEANANPDLCVAEDMSRSAKASGMEYNDLIQRILTLGRGYRPAWKER